jgi:hypothetical protein
MATAIQPASSLPVHGSVSSQAVVDRKGNRRQRSADFATWRIGSKLVLPCRRRAARSAPPFASTERRLVTTR